VSYKNLTILESKEFDFGSNHILVEHTVCLCIYHANDLLLNRTTQKSVIHVLLVDRLNHVKLRISLLIVIFFLINLDDR
jgi:hypothetical protein